MFVRPLLERFARNPGSRLTPRAKTRPKSCRLGVETLEDRCVPAAWLSVGNGSVVEGDTGTQNAVVQVTVTRPHGNNVTVNYNTANGSAMAGSDYNAVSGKLTFAKNETTKSILVPIRGDILAESDESFSVQLSNAKGAQIADGVGNIYIADNEPRVTIGDATIVEGDSGTATMTFNVYLQYEFSLPVHIDYATADGTATAGSDYAAVASGSLTIPEGQTVGTIDVAVNGDLAPEWDETILVNLTTPDSYVAIADNVGVGTIYDNEARIYISDAYQDYYASTITFYVTLTVPQTEVVTVDFTTWDGYAIADLDYIATWGTLTFNPGETLQMITVELLALDPDPYKYFSIQLSNASTNALLGNDWANAFWYYDWGYYYDPGYWW